MYRAIESQRSKKFGRVGIKVVPIEGGDGKFGIFVVPVCRNRDTVDETFF
jgi:hypothetical protein